MTVLYVPGLLIAGSLVVLKGMMIKLLTPTA
jgi:hypothetical protein